VSILPKVGGVMGSESDREVMETAAKILTEFGVPHEMRVISAHRTPEKAHKFGTNAADRGLQVIIAGAGKAAHLAGVLASLTTIPVIGVPMKTSNLGGLDSLLSTVQMPVGIPVATPAIGIAGVKNAALFAVAILALSDEDLGVKLRRYRARLREKAHEADLRVRGELQ